MHAPPPLDLELQRSRLGALSFSAVHLLGMLGAVLSGLPYWVMVPLLAALSYSAARSLGRHALLLHPESVIRVRGRADGAMEGLTRDGEWLALRLMPESTLFPFFAVLCFSPEGGSGRRRNVTVFPDALPADDWRTLCVWLRWAFAPDSGR